MSCTDPHLNTRFALTIGIPERRALLGVPVDRAQQRVDVDEREAGYASLVYETHQLMKSKLGGRHRTGVASTARESRCD
jgi:hypothetical protein